MRPVPEQPAAGPGGAAAQVPADGRLPDPLEPLSALLRDLRTSRTGLTSREAARRLVAYGPNELSRRSGRRWPRELAQQLIHPLALLLAAAAVLAWASGAPRLAMAIAAVIVLNAVFAFVQEMQAERAVEALAAFLPERAEVTRDGTVAEIPASKLVPGDLLTIGEGDRICADARLIAGSVEVDLSTINGESVPVTRSAGHPSAGASRLQAENLLFSGTACTGGEAQAVATATGMQTELGRIAALSQRVTREESPLEQQVRRVARLIAYVAVGAGCAFLPIGLLAGLTLTAAASFAIGLLVANVPEGLLPTITLALAVGVRDLARRGAIVRRLSAVETLGSTTVICTDKTGTLTRNQMRAESVWLPGTGTIAVGQLASSDGLSRMAGAITACNNAELASPAGQPPAGDPTELALLDLAAGLGTDTARPVRDAARRAVFRFDPELKLMSTVDSGEDGLAVHVKGAPEEVLARSARIAGPAGDRPLSAAARQQVAQAMRELASRGLRVLAVAVRELPAEAGVPARRGDAERDLSLLGLVSMADPPRPEVAAGPRPSPPPSRPGAGSTTTSASSSCTSSVTPCPRWCRSWCSRCRAA